MRWQGRRESDNVEDRRNSSGGPSMGEAAHEKRESVSR